VPAGVAAAALPPIAREALSLLGADPQRFAPGWAIVFDGPRNDVEGLTLIDERVIRIYLRRNMTARHLAHVVAHELGHAYDVSSLDDARRALFRGIRGQDPAAPWWPASNDSDGDSGAGDWAECFAVMLVGPDDWRSPLGPPPDAVQLAALRGMVGLA
jgi:hypothetical protein